jgi:hypothetical protein
MAGRDVRAAGSRGFARNIVNPAHVTLSPSMPLVDIDSMVLPDIPIAGRTLQG